MKCSKGKILNKKTFKNLEREGMELEVGDKIFKSLIVWGRYSYAKFTITSFKGQVM